MSSKTLGYQLSFFISGCAVFLSSPSFGDVGSWPYISGVPACSTTDYDHIVEPGERIYFRWGYREGLAIGLPKNFDDVIRNVFDEKSRKVRTYVIHELDGTGSWSSCAHATLTDFSELSIEQQMELYPIRAHLDQLEGKAKSDEMIALERLEWETRQLKKDMTRGQDVSLRGIKKVLKKIQAWRAEPRRPITKGW